MGLSFAYVQRSGSLFRATPMGLPLPFAISGIDLTNRANLQLRGVTEASTHRFRTLWRALIFWTMTRRQKRAVASPSIP